MYCSVDQGEAHKETKKDLRVLQPCDKQFIEWELNQSLIDLIGVLEVVHVYFDLNCQDGDLVCCNLKLIRLTVE